MRKDDCIFCKLANGDIPTNSIYEDDDFNVILDASPATKGHALILPKEHYSNIYEIDEEVLAKTIKLAKKIIVKETETLKCDGYNIIQNNEGYDFVPKQHFFPGSYRSPQLQTVRHWVTVHRYWKNNNV